MNHVSRLINDLQHPEAYPHPAGEVILHQTHISLVFVTGDFAYKIKKPVDFGFVDYSTLDRRKAFCEREIELNRRLAPEVYLDVVPIVEEQGRLIVATGAGDAPAGVQEWAVRMRRLDERDTLLERLAEDRVKPGVLERTGRALAAFHATAQRGKRMARYATFDRVYRNTMDNFEQTREHIDGPVTAEVHERLASMSRDALMRNQGLIESRAAAGKPCDGHGDLRLEHIYLDDDGALTVVDCIEFNDAFRYLDPVADIAFLVMDLAIRGYVDEADEVLSAWRSELEEDDIDELLALYTAYRSLVRAKVHGLKAHGEGVGAEEREIASRRSRMHWGFALTVLAGVRERPRLVLVGGLPGTGKSTIARGLERHGWVDQVVRSDAVRKELAGLDPQDRAAADFGEELYSSDWTARTYETVRERAAEILARGGRVALDASFNSDAERGRCLKLARELGVQPVFVECRLSVEAARERISTRHGDVSDADATVHEQMAARWEPASPEVERVRAVVDTSGSVEENVDAAVRVLEQARVIPLGRCRQ